MKNVVIVLAKVQIRNNAYSIVEKEKFGMNVFHAKITQRIFWSITKEQPIAINEFRIVLDIIWNIVNRVLRQFRSLN